MITNTFYTPPELIVIVDPRARIQVREGRIIGGEDIEPLTGLLDSEQALMEPLFEVDQAGIASSMTTLMGMDQPLDLSIFHKVTCPDNKLESLAGRLRELSVVQAAYLKPPADVPLVDDRDQPVKRPTFAEPPENFSHLQDYLKPAVSGGIDAHFAWMQDGGRGKGIRVIDIEGGWNFLHEDLVENASSCVGGVALAIRKWRTHGTAVLGMLAGDHNNLGINGICPDADVRTVSVFNNADGRPSPKWGSAQAIKYAADRVSAGDILLLELHRPGPAVDFQENEQTQDGYIAVEWWPCDLAAILYATTRGIIVVEAAGNGQQNLCDDIYNQNPKAPHGPFPFWWVNPFKRKPIDTMAILVGAGVPPHGTHGSRLGPDRSRADFSNFGAVIDTQGWGEEVATCGGNNDLGKDGDPENRHYTRRFRGTSSAAAMIAGAICCLQGVLKTRKKTLRPRKARALLRDHNLGSPQQDGPFGPAHLQPIGPRPDLKKLIDHF